MMQELSLNVLDVAQNSVKAGAPLITITVEEDTAADRMTITIGDNGCGMTEEQVQRVIDPFYTTRTTRKVGLGVPFFKMAAEICGGSFTLESHVGQGTTVTAVFVRSSIDRMPLGDMAATMTALIGGNPSIDFVYTRRIDGRELTADTREFREVLAGVPLDTPEVLAFITEYINENTTEILQEED
ncbi:MAG: ATP-binding protein, partial [Angelakisella sp.]